MRLKEGCVRLDLSHRACILPSHETIGLPSPSSSNHYQMCLFFFANDILNLKVLHALCPLLCIYLLCALFAANHMFQLAWPSCDCVCFSHFKHINGVCVGLFSMRSALLSHSEWAQRASPCLQRGPRQNGAGAPSQWNHTGDHHKGKIHR